MLQTGEFLLIGGIITLMCFDCYLALKANSWVQIYRPTLFVAIVLAFYVLVGPLRALLFEGEVANFVGTSGTLYRGLDHRPFLFWGWLGAFIFYASLLAGFYFTNSNLRPTGFTAQVNLSKLRRLGFCLCILGVFLYSLAHGDHIFNLLNPLQPDKFKSSLFGISGLSTPFINYFKLAINLLIPGIIIQFAIWLRQRTGLWIIFSWFLLANAIFLSEAFRYRLLLLYIPLLMLWFFYYKRRPRLIFLLFFMLVFIGLNGLVGIARTSLRGIDLQRASTYTPTEIFNSSFEESTVFFTTSAVIDYVPRVQKFAGFEPILTTLLQPIPRDLFSAKPNGSYSSDLRATIYQSTTSATAYLAYAEFYLIGGWFGICAFSFLLGFILKRAWTWFLLRQYEPIAQATYLLTVSYTFVIISRGYLPQMFMLFSFTVLPIYFIYYYSLRACR